VTTRLPVARHCIYGFGPLAAVLLRPVGLEASPWASFFCTVPNFASALAVVSRAWSDLVADVTRLAGDLVTDVTPFVGDFVADVAGRFGDLVGAVTGRPRDIVGIVARRRLAGAVVGQRLFAVALATRLVGLAGIRFCAGRA